VEGTEIAPGLVRKTPDVSKPHIGKEGLAEQVSEFIIRMTLDDGTILMGYECWWETIAGGV